jgi:hypothetical protein
MTPFDCRCLTRVEAKGRSRAVRVKPRSMRAAAVWASEAENRVELDRVRGYTGLAVLEVEEGDPGDTGVAADANGLSGPSL